jgi:hypothetical protein
MVTRKTHAAHDAIEFQDRRLTTSAVHRLGNLCPTGFEASRAHPGEHPLHENKASHARLA